MPLGGVKGLQGNIMGTVLNDGVPSWTQLFG